MSMRKLEGPGLDINDSTVELRRAIIRNSAIILSRI
jgi:hypothetical protein